MSEKGLKIVIWLKTTRRTQRWLLEQLNKKDFPTLKEPTLSSILNGRYTGGCANAVLQASEEIVQSSAHTTQAE